MLALMARVVADYVALNPTVNKSVSVGFYLRAKTDYSNTLAHELISGSRPFDGSSIAARVTAHWRKCHTDRIPSTQPRRAFVAQATESESYKTFTQGS